MLDRLAATLDFPCDLTAECITHRFTPGSKDVLLQWYPNTSLDLEEATRAVKRNKFGGTKFVYQPADMRTLKEFFHQEWQLRFPNSPLLYWT
ncbi:hypothetical protein MUN84_19555 [Hymenobacter sp. 5516J-16]|nr:hypothetical protein [Hymenobacter sp. 5516J-16]UOQ76692.1 hypothetical protein MUN84_19555 [Hymenobacter sp. 5516J-16]